METPSASESTITRIGPSSDEANTINLFALFPFKTSVLTPLRVDSFKFVFKLS